MGKGFGAETRNEPSKKKKIRQEKKEAQGDPMHEPNNT
jgi:hypothetical protein